MALKLLMTWCIGFILGKRVLGLVLSYGMYMNVCLLVCGRGRASLLLLMIMGIFRLLLMATRLTLNACGFYCIRWACFYLVLTWRLVVSRLGGFTAALRMIIVPRKLLRLGLLIGVAWHMFDAVSS